MADENLIVWLVDDDEAQLRLYQEILQNAFETLGTTIAVEPVEPYPRIGDYHDIIGDPRTAALIIDQRLGDSQPTDHTGIQLATRLRSVSQKLPIYILTTYADIDDFEGKEWSVEDILRKEILSGQDDPDNQREFRIIMERLLRRINVHQGMLEDRDRRFRELLKKSLEEELTPIEKSELDELRFARTAVILSDEQEKLSKLEAALDRLKNLQSNQDK